MEVRASRCEGALNVFRRRGESEKGSQSTNMLSIIIFTCVCVCVCVTCSIQFWALIFTCSCLQRHTKWAVADTIRGFNREIINDTTFQAFDDAGVDRAGTVKHLSIHRLGTAKILHSALTGIPRQDGRVGLTIIINCEIRGLTRHCMGRQETFCQSY